MSISTPVCKTVTVYAFRGDRSRTYVAGFLQALDDEKTGRGPSPTSLDCLLYAGHTGVSVDDGLPVFGFNPDGAGIATWQLMDRLKRGDAFPGVVRDDTHIFGAARRHPLTIESLNIILPDPQFHAVRARA